MPRRVRMLDSEEEEGPVAADQALKAATVEPLSTPVAKAAVPAGENAPSAQARTSEIAAAPPAARPAEVQDAAADEPETGEPWVAALAPIEEPSREAGLELPAPASSGYDSEFIVSSEDETPSRTDPYLEEPPAVRVTPEPALMADEAQGSPEYGAGAQEVRSLAFFPSASLSRFACGRARGARCFPACRSRNLARNLAR